MEINELRSAALDAAAPHLPGAVAMLNLVRFRPRVLYPEGFAPTKADPRSAYFEGYAGAFREVAKEVGVEGIDVVFRGPVAGGLVVAPEDVWDEVIIVRYRSFADFRRIVESEQYKLLADPHRRAAVANWRLIATSQE